MPDITVHLPIGDGRNMRTGRQACEGMFLKIVIDPGSVVIIECFPLEIGEQNFFQFFPFCRMDDMPVECPDFGVFLRVVQFILQPAVIGAHNRRTAYLAVDTADNQFIIVNLNGFFS